MYGIFRKFCGAQITLTPPLRGVMLLRISAEKRRPNLNYNPINIDTIYHDKYIMRPSGACATSFINLVILSNPVFYYKSNPIFYRDSSKNVRTSTQTEQSILPQKELEGAFPN